MILPLIPNIYFNLKIMFSFSNHGFEKPIEHPKKSMMRRRKRRKRRTRRRRMRRMRRSKFNSA